MDWNAASPAATGALFYGEMSFINANSFIGDSIVPGYE